MQADPIKPTPKAPRTKRLKQNYDELFSHLAFKSNVRRYNLGAAAAAALLGVWREKIVVSQAALPRDLIRVLLDAEAGVCQTQCRRRVRRLSPRNRGSIYSRIVTRSDIRRIGRPEF